MLEPHERVVHHVSLPLDQLYLVLPCPVTLTRLLFLLLLVGLGPGLLVDHINLPEVAHGELEERVLAVIGHLQSGDADVGGVASVVAGVACTFELIGLMKEHKKIMNEENTAVQKLLMINIK